MATNVADVSSKQEGLSTVPIAAGFLSISKGKLYAMLHSGECPSVRFGKSVRIPWVWLHAQAGIVQNSEVAR